MRTAHAHLTLDGTELRYRPLAGLATADYVEQHLHLLESSGALDSLVYSNAELRLSKDGKIDLAGFAALGRSFASLLTRSLTPGDEKAMSASTLRQLIVNHCELFAVEVKDGDTWVPLNSAEALDAHLEFGQMLDVVTTLAGGVLRPLWNRLRSAAEVKRSESANSLPETSQES